jgi:hypothetical protein
MAKAAQAEKGGTWKTVSLIVLLVALAGVVTWTSFGGGDDSPPVQSPAICLGCNQTGSVTVSATPGLEEWPRECPKCHAKKLYLSRPCPRCKAPLAFKDPNSEKFGEPTICPHCKRSAEGF